MITLDRESLEKELNWNVPVTEGKDIIIWGTGNTAQLYQEGFARIRQEGFSIKAYCDNNMNKWGKDFYGKPIISPSELKRYKDACVLICTPTPKAIREISAQLDEICVSYYYK